MRASVAIALAVGGAVLGGLLALGLAGPLGVGGEETTLVVETRSPGSTAPIPTTTPDAGALTPAQIYRRRSDGVVTIYSELPDGSTSQGSGFIADPQGSILTNA